MPRKEILLRQSTQAKLNEPTLGIGRTNNLPHWIVPVKQVFYVSKSRMVRWCRSSYPAHLQGCPHVDGKCKMHIHDGLKTSSTVDHDKPMWIIYGEYDLAARVAELRANHPDWSERKARCIRYWQRSSLKMMNDRVDQFLEIVQPQRLGHLTYLSESDGVNLWRTATHAGIHLDRIRGMKCCRHLVLLCFTRSK